MRNRTADRGDCGCDAEPLLAHAATVRTDNERLTTAEENIRIAENIDRLNRFVVDLRCIIAIRMGDLQAAEKQLAILERADPGGYYLHRRSVHEQALGDQEAALDYAKKAEEAFTRPPFEVVANLANAQMEAGALDDAGLTLAALDRNFPTINRDTKMGLRCKLEIRRGDLDTAQALWEQVQEKHTPVHLGLRVAMLTRKAQARPLIPDEVAELERLDFELTEANWESTARLFGSLITSGE